MAHGVLAVAGVLARHRILAMFLAALVIGGISGAGHLTRCNDMMCRCPLSQRWFAGRSLNGHTLWDSTFWHEGRNVMTATGHGSRFQKLAGWEKRAWRTLPVITVPALAWFPALAALVITGLVVLAGRRLLGRTHAGQHLTSYARGLRRHKGIRVQPMAAAMATITGTAPRSLQAGITWNPAYAGAEPGGHVATWGDWPAGFKATGKERALVADLWRSRVGFDLVFDWRTADTRPELVMTRARELPPIVYLHEVLERVEALSDDKTAIGLDDQGNLICWDWASESPHGLLNAGSRHGKTESEEGMVAQVLRKGGRCTYVDVKRVSIQGLAGLPGLTLCDNPRDMPGIWLAIQAWGLELDDRIDQRTQDPTVEFDRNLLVIEEVNQFSEMCDEFWETWPAEDDTWRGTILWKPKHAKKTPPIWRVVKKGVWEGAFAKCNVLIAGQNIEGQTVKGVRNSIGMRLLGGYQPQNWKALVGTTPVPPAPPVKGRWCLVNGSTQTWVQAIIADLEPVTSAAIWRDYARSGRRLDGTVPANVAENALSFHGADLAIRGPGPKTWDTAMTLEQAVSSGVHPSRSLGGARRASTRDADHPKPVARRGAANVYDVRALDAYRELKERVSR